MSLLVDLDSTIDLADEGKQAKNPIVPAKLNMKFIQTFNYCQADLHALNDICMGVDKRRTADRGAFYKHMILLLPQLIIIP
jgi:hypothetical protein